MSNGRKRDHLPHRNFGKVSFYWVISNGIWHSRFLMSPTWIRLYSLTVLQAVWWQILLPTCSGNFTTSLNADMFQQDFLLLSQGLMSWSMWSAYLCDQGLLDYYKGVLNPICAKNNVTSPPLFLHLSNQAVVLQCHVVPVICTPFL